MPTYIVSPVTYETYKKLGIVKDDPECKYNGGILQRLKYDSIFAAYQEEPHEYEDSDTRLIPAPKLSEIR